MCLLWRGPVCKVLVVLYGPTLITPVRTDSAKECDAALGEAAE